MDRNEAKAVLDGVAAEYRQRPYAHWESLIGKDVLAFDATAPGGRQYQVEITPLWDDKPGGAIRVLFSVDDGSLLGAMRPVCDSLLLAKDDRPLGE